MACVADERPAGVASEGGDGGRGGHGIRDGGPITCERGQPWRSMAWRRPCDPTYECAGDLRMGEACGINGGRVVGFGPRPRVGRGSVAAPSCWVMMQFT